ncbi:MAG: hypothetical protein LBQ42_13660 [Synergistaceae bacterium]|jgi:hypothetical protein|nr:hypothetical protein [Synergistaceae bacterium]
MTLLDSFLIGLGVKPELSGLNSFKNAVLNTVKVVGGITLAFKAAQGLVQGAVLGMAANLDSLSDAAIRAGTSVSELDKLEFIASQTDSSAEAARSALLGISRAAGQAASGMKESQEAFDKLGIKIKDSNGKIKSSTALFYEVGDALKKMDKAQQLAYARKFRLDPTIVTTMTSDISALKDEYDAFANAAGVDLATAAQASSDLMDEIGKFGKLSQMIMRSVMTGFILKMKESFIALRKWFLEHADTVKKTIQTVMSFIERMSNFMSSTFSRFGMIFSRLADWWETLDDDTQKLILSVVGLAAAFKLLNLGWLLTPIGLVVGAITALFLLWDDLMTYLEGGESLIDWGPWVDDIMAAAAVVQELWDKLKEFAAWVWERLDFTGIFDGFKTQLAGVGDAIIGAFGFLKGLFSGDREAINAGLERALGGLVSIAEGIGQQLLGVFSNAVKLIGDMFGVDLSGLVSVVENVFGDIIETARNLVEPFVDVFRGAVDLVSSLFKGDFTGAIEAAGNIVKSVFDGIKAVVLGAISVFEDIVNFILKAFGVDVQVTFNSLKSFVELVFSGITKAVDIAKDALSVAVQIITGVIGGLIGILQDAWNWVKKVTGFGKSAEEEKADMEDRVLREKYTKRESFDAGGGIYTDATTFDEEGYQKELAERKKQQAESGASSQNQAPSTQPDQSENMPQPENPAQSTPSAQPAPTAQNAGVETPPLAAGNVEVEKPPIVTEPTKAGKVETNTTNIQQNNNVNNDVKITVEGSGDPEDVADRVASHQDDATRYTPPVVSPYAGRGAE